MFSLFLKMLYLKQQKTLDNYVLVNLDLVIRVQLSIELFKISWLKVEISLITMAQEANPFMEINLKMKILLLNTLKEDNFQWQMQDQTQTVVNFSLLLSNVPAFARRGSRARKWP